MRVFITGVSGFIGRALARRWVASGWQVRGSARPQSVQSTNEPGVEVFAHVLGTRLPEGALDGVDCLVHCSYDFARGHSEQNLAGTACLLEQSRAAGVRRALLVSSYSAHSDATSLYGRTKRDLEALFEASAQPVARAGLVIGRGGLFHRLARTIRRSPVVPMLDGGHKRVPVLSIDNLCEAFGNILSGSEGGPFHLASEQPVEMRDLVAEIERVSGRHPLHVPVPASWLLRPLRMLEALRLPFPVTSENLGGYISNTMLAPSDLHRFVSQEHTLPHMVELAAR